jgi:hypothetical protein
MTTSPMRTLIVTNIISVDGFYSGTNDDVMAMPFDTTFSDYNLERLRAADTLLLGRRSFEGFRDYWPRIADDPDQPAVEREISRLDNAIEKVVVSDSLTDATSGPGRTPPASSVAPTPTTPSASSSALRPRDPGLRQPRPVERPAEGRPGGRAAPDDRLRLPRRRRAGLQRPAHRSAPTRRATAR